MVSVSFAGVLGNSVSGESFSDKWYLWLRSQHPPWTQHGVVRVPTASSWCKDMCTVTLGLTTGFESFCKDQTECLTKPADGKPFLCLGDTQSVGFLRVLRGEQRGDWHGGEFPHEDDCQVSSSGNDPCAKHGGGLVLFCFASCTSRPPGSLHLSLDFNSTEIWNPHLDFLHEDDCSSLCNILDPCMLMWRMLMWQMPSLCFASFNGQPPGNSPISISVNDIFAMRGRTLPEEGDLPKSPVWYSD